MSTLLIKNGTIVNEGKIAEKDILIENGFIAKIEKDISLVSLTALSFFLV